MFFPAPINTPMSYTWTVYPGQYFWNSPNDGQWAKNVAWFNKWACDWTADTSYGWP